jgi:hypothetical protein
LLFLAPLGMRVGADTDAAAPHPVGLGKFAGGREAHRNCAVTF